MATASVTYALSNGTDADATHVQTNFNDLVNFLNTQVLHKDGSVSMTGLLTLHAADPTSDNHAARKSYVDTKAQASLPPGAMTPWLGDTAPADWVLMYGQTITGAQSAYPTLWSNVSSTWKSGSDLIVPDIRGRIPVGLDNMGGSDAGRLDVANTMGGTGGAQKHTLTQSEMPAHQHTPNAIASFLTTDYGSGNAYSVVAFQLGGVVLDQVTLTSSVGGGAAHNNMQPYILLNWILKLK